MLKICERLFLKSLFDLHERNKWIHGARVRRCVCIWPYECESVCVRSVSMSMCEVSVSVRASARGNERKDEDKNERLRKKSEKIKISKDTHQKKDKIETNNI